MDTKFKNLKNKSKFLYIQLVIWVKKICNSTKTNQSFFYIIFWLGRQLIMEIRHVVLTLKSHFFSIILRECVPYWCYCQLFPRIYCDYKNLIAFDRQLLPYLLIYPSSYQDMCATEASLERQKLVLTLQQEVGFLVWRKRRTLSLW